MPTIASNCSLPCRTYRLFRLSLMDLLRVWRHAVAVATWTLGGLEARCWRSDVEACRYGSLKVRCRRTDVDVWQHRAFEVWRRVAGCRMRAKRGTKPRFNASLVLSGTDGMNSLTNEERIERSDGSACCSIAHGLCRMNSWNEFIVKRGIKGKDGRLTIDRIVDRLKLTH